MGREIAAGFWSDVTRVLFGAVETAPYNVSDDIVASVVLEMERPEYAYLSNQFFFTTRNLTQAATGAGNFGSVGIVNRSPKDLVVVMGFQSTGAVAAFFKRNILPDATFEAAINTEVPALALDTRMMKVSAVEATVAAREFTADVLGGALSTTPLDFHGAPLFRLPARTGWPLAILGPGSWFAAEAITANSIVGGVFYGYTRPLFSGNRA